MYLETPADEHRLCGEWRGTGGSYRVHNPAFDSRERVLQ